MLTSSLIAQAVNKTIDEVLLLLPSDSAHLCENIAVMLLCLGAHAEGLCTLSVLLEGVGLTVHLAQIHEPSGSLHRVAYQGVPGAYSESAARKVCPDAEPLPCEQFEVAFQALTQWLADTAVLPIENSVGGSIHTVFDLLIKCALLSLNHILLNLSS